MGGNKWEPGMYVKICLVSMRWCVWEREANDRNKFRAKCYSVCAFSGRK